jgi:hypothetical protein
LLPQVNVLLGDGSAGIEESRGIQKPFAGHILQYDASSGVERSSVGHGVWRAKGKFGC